MEYLFYRQKSSRFVLQSGAYVDRYERSGPPYRVGGRRRRAAPGTVQLKDFAIQDLPDTLPTGLHVFRIENAGPQPHEANILQLAAGTPRATRSTTSPTPSPFTPAGGVQGVTPGVATR